MTKNRIASALIAASCLVLGACSSDSKTADAGADKSMAATPVNTACPFSGKPVNASMGVVDYHGKNIGFCCNGCKDAFTKADDAKKSEMVAKLNLK